VAPSLTRGGTIRRVKSYGSCDCSTSNTHTQGKIISPVRVQGAVRSASVRSEPVEVEAEHGQLTFKGLDFCTDGGSSEKPFRFRSQSLDHLHHLVVAVTSPLVTLVQNQAVPLDSPYERGVVWAAFCGTHGKEDDVVVACQHVGTHTRDIVYDERKCA